MKEGHRMRCLLTAAVLLVATVGHAAEELPKATRVIEGSRTTFPEKTLADGAKTLAAALESCHDLSDGTIQYSPHELTKAQQGDHVRFVFSKPLGVTVLDTKLAVSEAVFANGVFWLMCGKEVVRATKYEYDKMTRFQAWYRQTLPAD
jgi:hypothetical protein